MNARMIPLGAPVVLLTAVLLAGCATSKYVPKANEELYGTWVNENSLPQRIVQVPDGWEQYLYTDDSQPFARASAVIVSKWTDAEGNIWYKSFGTITAGLYPGEKFTELDKLSKSGTVWEFVWTMPTNDRELITLVYPTKIDPKSPEYGIYHRAEN